ncbi:PAS domain S-box protein [Hymenobacter segetis]|uniref:histidine kinase n=2 Tax=Hymenobacter segetis TaxID=2025509 RepID=A0ABU9M1J3_9BACT
MVSSSPDMICALSPDGQFRQVSDACHRALGYDTNEMIGKHLSEIIHPDDVATALEKFLVAFGHADPVGFESRCLSKNGQEVHIAWSALRAATDELLICVGRDITQQRQAAQQAREQQLQHRAIIENGFDMVGIVDEQGVYTYVGGATQRILGYRPEEMVGRSGFDFFHPDDLAMGLACFALLATQDVVAIPDFRFRAASGEWRWLETSVSALVQDGNQSYIVNSRDITERKLSSLAQAESEQRFRALFDNDSALTVFLTPDGRILDANPALLTFLKKAKKDVINLPLAGLLPEEVRPLFEQAHLEAAGGAKVAFETRVQIEGEAEKTLKVTKTPLVVNGELISVHGTVRDITEMATAQRLIKHQAAQLNTLLESINDAFISLDKDWKLTYINSQAEQLLGISREGGLGINFWRFFSEEAGGVYYQHFQRAIDTGETVRFEAYFEREQLWLELKAYPFADGLSVLFTDITKRVEDEKQLKLLALVARGTDNGVVITDAQGRTEWVNEAFMKHTGYSWQELVGRTPGAVLQGPETDPTTVSFIRERMQQPAPFSATILNYKKSGKKLWFAMDITPIHNEAGEITQYVAIQQNITYRKEVEASQAAMTQDLYRHNRDLQQFTYVISHNLRAPLANALGLAKVLLKVDKNTDVFATTLTNLQHSMVQADDVLKDLNLVLSIRDKKDMLALEPLVMKDVCQQAVRDLEDALRACGGQVALDIEEQLITRGNRAYLYSIFYNLLSNSIKYRSEQRPLQVEIVCSTGAHGGATITFTDNGSGFDMFKAGSDVFQLYKRFHTNQQGRGIGLFLVKTHVEAMGGKIEVTSEVNFGTRFTIYLDKR